MENQKSQSEKTMEENNAGTLGQVVDKEKSENEKPEKKPEGIAENEERHDVDLFPDGDEPRDTINE